MAQINKYRGEKWRARIRKVGYPEQAKTFDTKRDAEKWARAIESSIDNGGQTHDVKEAMTYGERLQDALNRAGRTRRQLAAAMGVTPQAIGMVLNSSDGLERKLSALNNEKAAAYLGVSRMWLLTGEDHQEQEIQKISDGGLDALLDLLPRNDHLLRAQVFAAASQVIISAVVDSRKTPVLHPENRASP